MKAQRQFLNFGYFSLSKARKKARKGEIYVGTKTLIVDKILYAKSMFLNVCSL